MAVNTRGKDIQKVFFSTINEKHREGDRVKLTQAIVVKKPLRKEHTFLMGVGQKGLTTSFSPVTSTNVGVSPQNFLTFSFNSFATLVLMFKAISIPNY